VERRRGAEERGERREGREPLAVHIDDCLTMLRAYFLSTPLRKNGFITVIP
jgi:hypothetical protein